jgi:tetrahydromethanopterin S-methyltransferase subunit G
MSFKETVLKMIRLTDKVDSLNDRIISMTDDLKDVDRRLVRVETIVEFAEKGLIGKRLGKDTE